MIKRILYLLLIILWINVIFSFSSDLGQKSDQKSLRIAVQVHKTLEKFKLSHNLDRNVLNLYIRKMAHISEYFILTILILGLLFTLDFDVKYKYWIAWSIAMMCAIIDEYNQIFVPGRDGSIIDVVIDNIGIILAMSVILAITRVKKEIRS